jgi:DNA-binding response OmpR family regulator
MMPKMSGMDLHAEVRRTAPALAQRFVFVTGGTVTPQSAAYLEEVANPRLNKPFRADELRALVRRVMGPDEPRG